MIDQFHLSATDVDSDDTKIRYNVILQPTVGYIIYRQFRVPENTSEWRLVDNHYEKNISTFLQTDIILENIFYRHFGVEVFSDSFTFYVSDNVPNRSGLKTFVINIASKDDLSPVLEEGCTLTLNLYKGQRGKFSKSSLSYIDGDSVDSDLIYKITSQPKYNDSNEKAGRIASINNIQKLLSSFSQKQVNHFQILFISFSIDIGNTSKSIFFTFDVEDSNGNALRNQTFNIHVFPVNEELPVFITSVLIVSQGERKNITSNHLNAKDDDTNTTFLSFILKKQPSHGLILYKQKQLYLGQRVSLFDIHRGQLQYVSRGDNAREDEARFVLTDQKHMVKATLQIEITPNKNSVISVDLLQKTLHVDENGVVEITSDMFQVSEEFEELDKMEFKVAVKPQYGIIKNKGFDVNTFNWKDLVTGVIIYHHTSGEIGIQNINDRMELLLANTSKDIVVDGKLYGGLILNIEILMVDSEPPSLNKPIRINVPEGGRTPIAINITDVDTKLADVYCSIIKSPIYGYIENLTPQKGSQLIPESIAVKGFTAQHLTEGNVYYVQNKHEKVEPNLDSITMQCSDGNNTSPIVTAHISISPINDEVPLFFVQDPIMCKEDELVLFDLSKINPYDRDIPRDDLTITVLTPPTNGELMLQTSTGLEAAKTFSYEDLSGRADTTVMYQHKGTETTNDVFQLQVSDGIHKINKTIRISIIPVDDERPQLIVNSGLYIERGETKIITTRNLQAVDLDSDDKTLLYFVMMESIFGRLQRLLNANEYEDLDKGSNFTQRDINEKKIRYVHLNLEGGERDSVRLDVTDGFNRLINQGFHIIITPEDIIIPEVVNRGFELPENSHKVLTTDVLSATDLNTPDEDLQFIVTKLPLRGYLEHSDYDGIPLTRFKQLDLAAGKISYKHTSSDEIKTDSFEFEVTDGRNKVFRTFRIQIQSVDNKKPTLQSETIMAYEGQDKVLTPFELRAVDNDTAIQNIIFRVIRPPKFGEILFAGKTRTYRFTQRDIDLNRISYRNLHPSTNGFDRFSVVISDGTHHKFFYPAGVVRKSPVDISIRLRIHDTNAPVLLTNNGASFLRTRHDRTFFKLSVNTLEAIDTYSTPEGIEYIVTEYPEEGIIINIDDKQTEIKKFTQQDINNRHIEYVLKSSNATEDSFIFNVKDTFNNTLKQQVFNLNWARVCTTTYQRNALESDQKIKVSFKRYGNIRHVGFSTIDILSLGGYKSILESEKTIQWKPNEDMSTTELTIVDNDTYEKLKTVIISLRDGINVVIADNCNMHLSITDPEDEPYTFLPNSRINVSESIGQFNIPIHRNGDLNHETSVYCVTVSGTALSTDQHRVSSVHDFISRDKNQESSLITFAKNESVQFCSIKILDDTTYEDNETFQVQLLHHRNSKIATKFSKAIVTIETDPDDEPVLLMEDSLIVVKENEGFVRIFVQRRSKDLNLHSYVQIATKQTFPVSAKANKDYMSIVKTLEFHPGMTSLFADVSILDDKYRPRVEGKENFTVYLSDPRNARLSKVRSESIVAIEDFELDRPVLYFKQQSYHVAENSGKVLIPIIRRGDTSKPVKLICFTRQKTAKVSEDFQERLRNDVSIVEFQIEDIEKNCEVEIIDDKRYEEDESFEVVLETLKDDRSIIITGNQTEITIADDDASTVQFSKKRYYAFEPAIHQQQTLLEVSIIRTGDWSRESRVTVISQDGSAMAGIHYQPIAKTLVMKKDVTDKRFNVTIYHVPSVSVRLAFSLLLATDIDDIITKVTNNRAVVTIEEKTSRVAVTFPLSPVVVSLVDYKNIKNARKHPMNGYPLICITACDLHHPQYEKTKKICNQEKIANKHTTYRWQIQSTDNKFEDVAFPFFFAQSDAVTLDSVYFNANSRIRCLAKAYSMEGGLGLESVSNVIIVGSSSNGLCARRENRTSPPFSAQASYISEIVNKHKNMIKVKILIPHQDGMLPIFSTKRLMDVDVSRAHNARRTQTHLCSNLLNVDEISTRFGFLTPPGDNIVYMSYPFEHNMGLRGNRTVNFYKHLNLDSCLWTFESYYDINELISKCGAKMITNGNVQSPSQSSFDIRIPLFVTYFYRRIGDSFTLHHHQSSIRLTAVYDTGVVWNNGVKTTNGLYDGELFPTSITVKQKDKRLLIKFKTKANFNGVFLLKTRDGELSSVVSSSQHPSMSFTLKHIRSDATYDKPYQEWQVTSTMAIRDYTGVYTFEMIPCVVESDKTSFVWPPKHCTPSDYVKFQLPLSIHQTAQPVDATFTLNTKFFITKKPEQYLKPKFEDSNDVTFEEGDTIYGRVLLDHTSSSYRVKLDKAYLCTGKDGFIPVFNPNQGSYGCMVDSTELTHRLKVLDRSNPDTMNREFKKLPFNATFTSNNIRETQSDGFSLDSTPLFKLQSQNERTWFLHVIYKIRLKKRNDVKRRTKRETLFHEVLYSHEPKSYGRRVKRSHDQGKQSSNLRDIRSIGHKKGTNLKMLLLIKKSSIQTPSSSSDDDTSMKISRQSRTKASVDDNNLTIGIAVGFCSLFVIVIIIIVILKKYHLKNGSSSSGATATETTL